MLSSKAWSKWDGLKVSVCKSRRRYLYASVCDGGGVQGSLL
jgi:hypothetical protein